MRVLGGRLCGQSPTPAYDFGDDTKEFRQGDGFRYMRIKTRFKGHLAIFVPGIGSEGD